jgi:hypothetical protein
MMLPAPVLADSALPEGFVYLRDIDPTIVQDIRYAGSHNFVGRPIRGYLAAECILSRPAAKAVQDVQRKLAEKELSLIVWDCYRPKRAVDDFLQWSKTPARSEMKSEFYPRTDKESCSRLDIWQNHHGTRGGARWIWPSYRPLFHPRRRRIRRSPLRRARHQRTNDSRMERSILSPAMTVWTRWQTHQTLVQAAPHYVTVKH